MLGLHCCAGFSPAAESRGYSPGAVCGLLTAVASLVAVPGLQSIGSIVVAHTLGCSMACGIEPMPSALAGRFLPLSGEGSPLTYSFSNLLHSFLLLNNFPLDAYTTVYLSVY